MGVQPGGLQRNELLLLVATLSAGCCCSHPRTSVTVAATMNVNSMAADAATAPQSDRVEHNSRGAASQRNVLFVVVDDMRPAIGAYNFSLAYTPNLDRLAREGLVFGRAFVQYAYCGPSRNSFMTGRRPDTTKVWEFDDHFREAGPGTANGVSWQSLPQYFKQRGYVVLGSGKLFHPKSPPDNDCPRSWSVEVAPYYSPECTGGPGGPCPSSSARGPPGGPYSCLEQDPPAASGPAGGFGGSKGSFCAANVSIAEDRFEYQLQDQRIRHSGIAHLKLVAHMGKPFFVGVGFHKPHAPWHFPAKFLQHFPRDLDEISLAKDTFAPIDMPLVAWHTPGDIGGFNNSAFNLSASGNATRSRIYRRAYYAAVAYQDYNIGQLLDTMDELDVAANTVAVVFGDHGWQLGEHALWSKMSLFEAATRVPLIIRAPWLTESVGRTTQALVEMVDIFPTLAALAGLPDPLSEGEDVNGTSLLPLFLDPAGGSVKDAAFSQFAKCGGLCPNTCWLRNDCPANCYQRGTCPPTSHEPLPKQFYKGPENSWDIGPLYTRAQTAIMGYSIRTNDWRYSEWWRFHSNNVTNVVRTDLPPLGVELYAHAGDKGNVDWPGENVNVVGHQDNQVVVKELRAKLLDYIQLSKAM